MRLSSLLLIVLAPHVLACAAATGPSPEDDVQTTADLHPGTSPVSQPSKDPLDARTDRLRPVISNVEQGPREAPVRVVRERLGVERPNDPGKDDLQGGEIPLRPAIANVEEPKKDEVRSSPKHPGAGEIADLPDDPTVAAGQKVTVDGATDCPSHEDVIQGAACSISAGVECAGEAEGMLCRCDEHGQFACLIERSVRER